MQYPGATGCGARRNYIHPCLHKAKKNHASMCTNGKRLRSCFGFIVHTRKRIHQAKKNFLKKFKTASNCHII